MTKINSLDPWNISPLDYPSSAPLNEQLAFLVRYAILAPSSHNTQPWMFRIVDGGVDIFADTQRMLYVIDAKGRQLIMSCGAALFNLRTAIRRFGYRDHVDILLDPELLEVRPQGDRPILLARVTPGDKIAPDDMVRNLFDAIPHRHTNRKPFQLRPVSHQIATDLAAAAAEEGAWLVRLDPQAKRAAAALIAAADKVQYHDRDFRRELSDWLSPPRSQRADGIPSDVKGDSALMYEPMVVRTFDLGKRVAASEKDLAEGSPMLAVLGTADDSVRSWISTGQALQHLLLCARTHGLSASFLNQVVEVPEYREKLRVPDKDGVPQLILRFGYGPEAEPTPRRALEEVLYC